jgi:hypothetical protein
VPVVRQQVDDVLPRRPHLDAAMSDVDVLHLHDLGMPHDTRYSAWDTRGCPPLCPYIDRAERATTGLHATYAERKTAGAADRDALRDALAVYTELLFS